MERERHAEEAETGRLRIERDHELARLRTEGELALAESAARSRHELALLKLERETARAGIENDRTPAAVQARLIASLPEIMARLPKPDELRTVTVNGVDQTSVAGLITQLTAVLGRCAPPRTGPPGTGRSGAALRSAGR